MLLESAQITNYRSIDDSSRFEVSSDVTAFVGLNESGKTCVLQAIHKSLSKDMKFSFDADYPRKKLAEYNRQKQKAAVPATILTFRLSPTEQKTIESELGAGVMKEPCFSVTTHYEGGTIWAINYSEKEAVAHIALQGSTIPGFKDLIAEAETVRQAIEKLNAATLDEAGVAIRTSTISKYNSEKCKDPSLVWRWLVNHLQPKLPRTFYFDDYYTLPAKVNFADLQNRKDQNNLEEAHKTILALLEVSGVTIDDLLNPNGYESARARLESISANISDRIFQFWKQNDSIEVEFHVSDDPRDGAPYSNGKNFYVRIKSSRHRVSMPLSNRSKGFIWFFSFLIWFDKINAAGGPPPILLLDEPGLNLHALAQHDFLSYIEALAEDHQILYTTHSPFMIESSRLDRVRVVEDKLREGTQVSSNVSSSSKNTLFPLQAALGYTIAQNLFIQTKNLLVEGPSDLILLKFMNGVLEEKGRSGLAGDIAIVPAGGGSKIATFVALLAGNNLQFVSLTDYSGKPDPHLTDLVREKILRDALVLHYGQFRGGSIRPTDIEDLIPIDAYLAAFNKTYEKALSAPVSEVDLPAGDRILIRLDGYLNTRKILLRPSGGFNHYLVVQTLISGLSPDDSTLGKFESLLSKVSSLLA